MNEMREERRSALDEFANASGQDRQLTTSSMGISLMNDGPSTAHGAIAVAIYRDDAKVFTKLKALAAAAGQEWYYRFPVKNRKENRTDWIEGPSIKLANDLARIYGNCETDVRMQDLGNYWVFYARFIDLETGYSLTRPFQQRKSAGKIGGGDDERRLDIAFQIGASKAIRNVIVNALQTYADFAFDEARNALVDKIGRDLENYRNRTIERVKERVDIKRIEAVVGRVAGEWLAPDVARVIAMMKAVTDGMASLEETFPPLEGETKSGSEALSAFAGQSESAATSTATTQNPPGQGQGRPPSADGSADAADSNLAESAADSSTSSDQETIEQRLARRVADAPSEEAVHEIWEQMGLDSHYNDDPFGRKSAYEIVSKRVAELKKAKK